MTSDIAPASAGVLLRHEGAVDQDVMAYARTKIDAVLGRPGMPAVSGEVRIARASAPHVEPPWSARAELRVGHRQVVVLAEEATATEVVDRLQDRLRRQTEKAAHCRDHGHRTDAPPWRGGDSAE
ncbi:hypothetical protein WB401_13920 [Streptomyces brasiliscabiei]|uniref:Uncharacterized protein n=1 Tax=Streptomyces brasiliscabiei TaxID=2736302 RepID=A0ABU8GCA0_9ACTN